MSDRPVIVIGAGGHAKVVVAALLRLGRPILGLADASPEKRGARVLGIPIEGGDDWVETYPPDAVELALGIASVGLPRARRAVFESFKAKGYEFVTIVDPTAHLGPDITLGEGAQIMAGAVIQPSTTIGINTLINTRAAIDHDCIIGDHTHVAPGCTVSGFTRIGGGSHLGTGAIVVQSMTIGAHCVVGAGAVVIADIPDRARVVGNPAHELTA